MKKNSKLETAIIDPELGLRFFIACCFLEDAHTLWHRSQLEFKNPLEIGRSLRAKIFVDLLFSIECSLKSLLLFLAPIDRTTEKIYRSIRRQSHNLYGLALLLKESCADTKGKPHFSKRQLSMLKTASSLGADMRYELDVFFIGLHWKKFGRIIGPDRDITLNSISWMRSVEYLARQQVYRAIRVRDFYASVTNIRDEDFGEFKRKLMDFTEVVQTGDKLLKLEPSAKRINPREFKIRIRSNVTQTSQPTPKKRRPRLNTPDRQLPLF